MLPHRPLIIQPSFLLSNLYLFCVNITLMLNTFNSVVLSYKSVSLL